LYSLCLGYTGKIGAIGVEYPKIVEAGKEATLSIHLYDTDGNVYTGGVMLSITSIGKPEAIYFFSAPHNISATLVFNIVDRYIVQVVAKNAVSQATRDDIAINVVCK